MLISGNGTTTEALNEYVEKLVQDINQSSPALGPYDPQVISYYTLKQLLSQQGELAKSREDIAALSRSLKSLGQAKSAGDYSDEVMETIENQQMITKEIVKQSTELNTSLKRIGAAVESIYDVLNLDNEEVKTGLKLFLRLASTVFSGVQGLYDSAIKWMNSAPEGAIVKYEVERITKIIKEGVERVLTPFSYAIPLMIFLRPSTILLWIFNILEFVSLVITSVLRLPVKFLTFLFSFIKS